MTKERRKVLRHRVRVLLKENGEIAKRDRSISLHKRITLGNSLKDLPRAIIKMTLWTGI
jgi:hypothetical protein